MNLETAKLSNKVTVTLQMTVRNTFPIELTPEQLAALRSDWTVPGLQELKRALLNDLAAAIRDEKCDVDNLLFDESDWDFEVWGKTDEEEPAQVNIIPWDDDR